MFAFLAIWAMSFLTDALLHPDQRIFADVALLDLLYHLPQPKGV